MSPSIALTKPESTKASPSHILWGYLKAERPLLLTVCVYAMASSLLSLAAPLGVQLLVSNVAFGGLVQPLVILAVLVMVALLLAGAARALQIFAVERLQERLFVRVALRFAERLRNADIRSASEADGGRLAHRFFEIPTLQKALAAWFSDGIVVVMQIVVGTVLLSTYHAVLLTFSLLLVVLSAVVFLGLGKRGGETAVKESKAKYYTAAWFANVADDPLAYKTQWGHEGLLAHSEDLIVDYVKSRRKHFKIVFRQNVALLFVQVLATASLLAVGGYLVLQGSLTLGQLVASELVVTATVAGLAKLGKYLESYYDAFASAEKVSAVESLKEEYRGSLPITVENGGLPVTLSDVTVESMGGRADLRGLSLSLPCGAFVSVLGQASSGKSTLADALSGSLLLDAGSIEVAGVSLRDVDRQQWRAALTILREWGSDHRTVEEYLTSAAPNPSAEAQRRALQAAGLWDSLIGTRAGLSTVVANLSRSDRISLAIAYAIVRATPLVVIDGILDDLDARGTDLMKVLRTELPRSTIVLLTARSNLAVLAERQVHLVAGQIKEEE